MNKVIGGGVVDTERLGYPREWIHSDWARPAKGRELTLPVGQRQYGYRGADYVNRACDGGCGRVLKFTPTVGVRSEVFCHVCKKVTGWEVGV